MSTQRNSAQRTVTSICINTLCLNSVSVAFPPRRTQVGRKTGMYDVQEGKLDQRVTVKIIAVGGISGVCKSKFEGR